MSVFHHEFHGTVLREYDIRGIIGETLQPEDAFAIGRCFGSIVMRANGDKAGYLEAQVAFALARPDMAPAMRGILQRYA